MTGINVAQKPPFLCRYPSSEDTTIQWHHCLVQGGAATSNTTAARLSCAQSPTKEPRFSMHQRPHWLHWPGTVLQFAVRAILLAAFDCIHQVTVQMCHHHVECEIVEESRSYKRNKIVEIT